MRLSFLRIVVLSLVLVFFPARVAAEAAPVSEIPVLVLSSAPPAVAAIRAYRARSVGVRQLSTAAAEQCAHDRTTHRRHARLDFVRLFDRFLTECAWLR